jgi:hypothetical protein
MTENAKREGNNPRQATVASRAERLERPEPVGGISGPGRWLVAEFEATALFSLKMSSATSSVGKTLVIPTPYSIKMALVDAGFRAGFDSSVCDALVRSLANVEVRIAPAPESVITHTFVKVRQESRDSDPLRPYTSTISYRELAYLSGPCKWAFDLATADEDLWERLPGLLPYINYIGKRGSFVRFVRCFRSVRLEAEYTQVVTRTGSWSPPARAHIVPLDDFGPEADLETLSSYSARRAKRDQHRRFVETIVPAGIVNTGPGFTHYSRQ